MPSLLQLFIILIFVANSIIFLLPINASTIPSSKKSGYGEYCNSETTKCDKSLWLKCINETCTCIMNDEMVLDTSQGKCVTKAGEHCKLILAQSVSEIFIKDPECIKNSICNTTTGICNCKSNFYETIHGKCEPKKSINDTCETNDECKDDKHLLCVNGFCQCEKEVSEYSLSRDQCVGLALKKCLSSQCIQGAECNIKGYCQCKLPFEHYADEIGHCKPKKDFGEICKIRSSDCRTDLCIKMYKECKEGDAFLTCQDGFCGCDPVKEDYHNGTFDVTIINPDFEKLYPNGYGGYWYCGVSGAPHFIKETQYRHECVSRAGYKCNGNKHCTTNSHCSNRNMCECDLGYKLNSNGTCGVQFNKKCGDSKGVCNEAFVCNQATCACKHPKHQIYNEHLSQCLSIVNGICKTNTDCIDNAHCEMNNKFGTCKCNIGYVENEIGTCDLAFGSICSYNQKPNCDQLAGLECQNNICTCYDESFYFESSLIKCVGLVGSRCTESEACIENSVCELVFTGISGSCKCLEGYEAIENRKCLKSDPIMFVNVTSIPDGTNVVPAGYLNGSGSEVVLIIILDLQVLQKLLN